MKSNLNSIGDGVIVLALGVLFLSFALVAWNNISQTTGISNTQSTNNALQIGGLMIFSILFILAGLFKMLQGLRTPEQPTTLKAAAFATIAVYLTGFAGFGGLLFFLYRF